ncbi:hypothetical protein [Lampropedia aestuarii]|uniref:hypothetical protein n=1 Tax=Lampropedia aestuarii TaxID=2562762 RepID=UPI002468E9B0|nr:hypothetical protein [Lampropedia aestuarii]MDH5857801.1 hypothetical protein [Lampropedia aestuarii]
MLNWTPYPLFEDSSDFYPSYIASDRQGVWIILADGGVAARSKDDGATWQGITLPAQVNTIDTNRLGVWIAVEDENICRSADGGLTWSLVPHAMNSIKAIHCSPNGTWIASGSGIWRSVDDGLTWQNVTPAVFHETSYGVATDGNGVWIATSRYNYQGFIYRSVDDGLNWTGHPVGESGSWLWTVFYGTDGVWLLVDYSNYEGQSCLRSSDNGISWSPVASMAQNMYGLRFATDGRGHWIGVENSNIHESYDNAATFTVKSYGDEAEPPQFSVGIATNSAGLWMIPLGYEGRVFISGGMQRFWGEYVNSVEVA